MRLSAVFGIVLLATTSWASESMLDLGAGTEFVATETITIPARAEKLYICGGEISAEPCGITVLQLPQQVVCYLTVAPGSSARRLRKGNVLRVTSTYRYNRGTDDDLGVLQFDHDAVLSLVCGTTAPTADGTMTYPTWVHHLRRAVASYFTIFEVEGDYTW